MSDNTPNSPQMSEVVETTWLKPSLYGGRFTRKQYIWRLLLVSVIAGILESILEVMFLTPPTSLDGLENFQQEAMLLRLIITIPVTIFFQLPFGIKRAHDIGHNGTFVIILMVIGLIVQLLGCVSMEICTILSTILLIPALTYVCILLFQDSQKGTNAYGTSTKYPDTTSVSIENPMLTIVFSVLTFVLIGGSIFIAALMVNNLVDESFSCVLIGVGIFIAVSVINNLTDKDGDTHRNRKTLDRKRSGCQ